MYMINCVQCTILGRVLEPRKDSPFIIKVNKNEVYKRSKEQQMPNLNDIVSAVKMEHENKDTVG